MLGNFSFGDYFKREAIAVRVGAVAATGSGSTRDDIWITVFAGDDELGIGPDEEAIDAWMEVGVPRERIVECPREENFWQVGTDRSLRPVLGAVPRPGRRPRASPTICPAARTSASSSTGTSCSCSSTRTPRAC